MTRGSAIHGLEISLLILAILTNVNLAYNKPASWMPASVKDHTCILIMNY